MSGKNLKNIDIQGRLAEVLNDAPTVIVVAGKKRYITALKLGTQNLIAAESVKIQKAEEGNMLDLYKQFAQSIPSVIRCLCYAILNDRDKIFKDYATKEFSDEFYALYDQIEWESNRNTWMEVLVGVMQKLDLSFFWSAATTLTMIRESALMTKKKIAAQ